MMRRFLGLVLGLVLFCAVLPAFAEIPAADVWPLPKPPEGANPAEFAAPRMDWVDRVQGTLNRTEGKQYDLIFDGDSITDGWQTKGKTVWEARYAPLNAVDFGISGDKVEHVLWRLKEGQGAKADPKLVVLMIGTNNTGRDSADQIAAGIKNLVAAYLVQCPHARLLLLAVFPRSALPTDAVRAKIKEINKQIAALDDGGKRVTFLDIGDKFLQPDGTLTADIMPDMLHPNEKGYQIWADAIAPEIEKTFPNAPKGSAAPATPPALKGP
ncbi:Lysophospholipase L1 [Verrucomicrobium sp. GAS474]|uniref:GDSL-type esterase/lipase family protein n=1 Tax=Verrucomicrobium sp. GAS474 TaxID=1882831 RepID=UPI00087CFD52|nr:GDSL-type esterase/lipase family protein [Verrucomicrobium sp. GAS474]SDU02337.1 Lysophospholipase L1 [Verrucomicrobium sp. GAS474]